MRYDELVYHTIPRKEKPMKIDQWHSDTVPNPTTGDNDVVIVDNRGSWICSIPHTYRSLEDAQKIAACIVAAHNTMEMLKEALK